jgi:hypothetical protein
VARRATVRPSARRPRRPNLSGLTKKGKATPLELKLLWISAGGNPKYADAMAYIGGETGIEGSGDIDVVNEIGAVGPWQILGPVHGVSTRALQNPWTNARWAVKLFNADKRAGGTGFGPWKASEGKWGKVINQETGEVKEGALEFAGLDYKPTGLQKAAMAGDDLLEWTKAVGELAVGLTELLLTPEGWQRIAKVVIGGVVLIWALNQLSKAMFGVNPAKTVRKAAPV